LWRNKETRIAEKVYDEVTVDREKKIPEKWAGLDVIGLRKRVGKLFTLSSLLIFACTRPSQTPGFLNFLELSVVYMLVIQKKE
jgi:hypothetical protein